MWQQLWHQARSHAVDDADPKDRGPGSLHLSELALESVSPVDQVSSAFDQRGARIREGDIAGGPGDQGSPEILLQVTNVTAERGRQHVESLSRPAEMQRVSHGKEASELQEVQRAPL
ncbi:MAG: hypothetical protein RIB85_11245 [Thalassobaculum sp.]